MQFEQRLCWPRRGEADPKVETNIIYPELIFFSFLPFLSFPPQKIAFISLKSFNLKLE